MGSCSLLQGIFQTQGLNPGLPHCRQILYQLSQERSPYSLLFEEAPHTHYPSPADLFKATQLVKVPLGDSNPTPPVKLQDPLPRLSVDSVCLSVLQIFTELSQRPFTGLELHGVRSSAYSLLSRSLWHIWEGETTFSLRAFFSSTL